MPLISGNTTISYAQAIAIDLIKANHSCSEVITYMTWAREEGNSWLTQIGWTYEQMANYYEDFYDDIWTYVPGRVSPVGAAFHKATADGIDVYSSDGSHQNATGSYLAACVFYATIFKESPVGISYTTQTPTVTAQLQQIAHDIVLTDLYKYNIDKVRFNMSANDIVEGDKVDFTERIWMEPFPNSFLWSFEGGTTQTSTEENPTGIEYSNAGSFDVSLTISDACGYQESRTFSDTIKVEAPTNRHSITEKAFTKFYVSKASPYFVLTSDFINATVNVYDLNGRQIEVEKNALNINVKGEMASGYLIVEVLNGNDIYKEKILVVK